MKRILEILTLLLFVTLTLNVWADDYVDDVYYSPQPRGQKAKVVVTETNDAAKTVQNTDVKTITEANNSKEDGTITIEYLPQTADTVVVIRVKK